MSRSSTLTSGEIACRHCGISTPASPSFYTTPAGSSSSRSRRRRLTTLSDDINNSILPVPGYYRPDGYCFCMGSTQVHLWVHLLVRPTKWSDRFQIKTMMFQFRGVYACCASHTRFLPRDATHSEASIFLRCPSVCLSRSYDVSKRINVILKLFIMW